MLPSEILKKRIVEKEALSRDDLEKIGKWLEENAGCGMCAGDCEDAGNPIEKLGQIDLLSEKEAQALYMLAMEVQLGHLLLHFDILPFNSLEYDRPQKIFQKICHHNHLSVDKYYLLIASEKDEWDSNVVSDFIVIARSLLVKDADTIAGVLAHELAHLEEKHMLQWLCEYFSKRSNISLMAVGLYHTALGEALLGYEAMGVLERASGLIGISAPEDSQLQNCICDWLREFSSKRKEIALLIRESWCDIEADTRAVNYLSGTGYDIRRMTDHLKQARNYIAELSASCFADKVRTRIVCDYIFDQRIENLEKILAGLEKKN